ncbi:uncharacterized protein LOC110680551 [Aedes aegypti]|uniref:Uncharacterized protein n=1 Tax=Aedes aegypti TaxID=7159 RepID=A0A903VCV0_AEDAE|nr:uncharacterized protein LOC110680551 [Aedes aegypti]
MKTKIASPFWPIRCWAALPPRRHPPVSSPSKPRISAPKGRGNDDFMMTVSPSLLTPSDLEIWRAIKQGLDPKKIPQNYGLSVAAGYGDRYSKSMATTPTAQLGMIADDPHDGAGCDTGSKSALGCWTRPWPSAACVTDEDTMSSTTTEHS